MEMIKKTVLVIGSEGGLGQCLVREWQSHGYRALGADLHRADESCTDIFIQYDLSKKHSGSLKIFLDKERASVDAVFFVAACGYYGDFLEQNNIEELLRVNFLSLIQCLCELTPFLKKKALVLFVGSIASHMPTENYEVYSASKLALEGFVRSWRNEVQGELDVRVYLPGGMKTSFHQKIGFKPPLKLQKSFLTPEVVAKDMWRFSNKKAWRGLRWNHRMLSIVNHWMPLSLNQLFMWKKA